MEHLSVLLFLFLTALPLKICQRKKHSRNCHLVQFLIFFGQNRLFVTKSDFCDNQQWRMCRFSFLPAQARLFLPFGAENFSTCVVSVKVCSSVYVKRLLSQKSLLQTVMLFYKCGILQPAMIYNPIIKEFEDIVSELWYWVNRHQPPPDEPSCGFREEDCESTIGGSFIPPR